MVMNLYFFLAYLSQYTEQYGLYNSLLSPYLQYLN